MEVTHNVKLKNTPEYAAVLRSVRIDIGLSQEDLSKKLGISPMGLSHYERGVRTPNIERLDQWAQLLGYEMVISLKLKEKLARIPRQYVKSK